MPLEEITLALFAICNSIRIFAYLPQIHKAAKDKNGASAISGTTWSLFLVAHLSTIAHALVNLGDRWLAICFAGNALCCILILAIAWWKGRDRASTPRGALVAMGLGLMLMTGTAAVVAQDTVRIRGTIETEASGVYSVRTRENKLVLLKLAPSAGVAASIKSSLSDIQPGLYIGIAALPQADGSLRALEAHIFDETMRGTAEGHRAWDLLPKSTMTNAVVHDIIRAIDGHTMTLRYKDGEQHVVVPSETVVVTYLPGSRDELKPGAVIFVPAASSQPDGTLLAQRVMVGRNVAPPQ
jgi:uncharacterized protein with PQ loop repeat